MSDFNVNIFQHRGNSYQIGLNLGKQLFGTRIPQRFEKITHPAIDTSNMEEIYRTFAPHLLDELEGLADGLQVSRAKAAALFSGCDVPKHEALGCSAMLTDDYYVRNYDFTPELYDGYFSLIQPQAAFATAGYNLQVVGRHDGVNERGLVVGLHFVSNSGYTRGISAWTAIRMVLDTCSIVSEAIDMLKEMPHAGCYNFSMGDRAGQTAVVEASPEHVVVREDRSFLTCTNHFQAQSLQHKNRPVIDNSVDRHTYIQTMNEKKLTQEEVFDHFRDKESPLFYMDYDALFGTLHTFSYGYKNGRILTSIAQSDQVLDIHFDEWVAESDLSEQLLQGMIERPMK
ncbi:Predicted choloylglycine hydrolase [Lentibacillus halodurans]|uniref:Predicted choloylglycine hydrolase n=1 Tax=Lentibacillus halodurans TaxID=237679 RepID=A0A1I0X163_9BACI|nr:C45 family peptidase [Lentibacillus halodurans]SFA94574.1 Predicted choloylglycine hydrolase [Lentibacillus halodurans]